MEDKETTKLDQRVHSHEGGHHESDKPTFCFRKNQTIFILFISWAVVCLHTLVCLCPNLYGTSLWMSHFTFKLEDARGSLWLAEMEETLSILSSLSNDIHGQSAIDERTIKSISRNKYTFDFATWCRSNHQAKLEVCYRGCGLDVISSFVRDFGTQLGELGNSADPGQLGVYLANTYMKTINELDEVFVRTKRANKKTVIDMDKLKLVHQLKKSHTIGGVMWILKMIHGASFIAICIYKLSQIGKISIFYKVGCNKLAVVVFSVTLITVCQLCTFAIVVTETFFAAILNPHLQPYGVRLVHGPAYFLFLLEMMLGAIVTHQVIVY